MKTQNLKSSLEALALIALLSLPAFAQPAATDAPAAPAPAATPAAPAPVTPKGQILPTADRSTPIGSTISGSLDVTHSVSTIESRDIDARDKLLSEIAGRVSTADQQLADLKSKAGKMNAEGQQAAQSAWGNYQKAKDRLAKSLDSAKAADATGWERTRTGLAADYAFYASAVAGVEVALPN